MPSAQCKKRSEETQTLRAGCSKAKPINFISAADPLPRGAGWPKFNQLEMVTTFTYKLSLVRIDACNFEFMQFRVIVVTDPQTHTPTDRTNYNTLHCSFTSAQCSNYSSIAKITITLITSSEKHDTLDPPPVRNNQISAYFHFNAVPSSGHNNISDFCACAVRSWRHQDR